jgi:hypothetical protein
MTGTVRRKTLKISILRTFETLPDEQLKKRKLSVSDDDLDGIVKRHHVMDQTIFDHLLVVGLIEVSEHEAAHCFMDVLSQSGAYISSVNLDGGATVAYHSVGDAIGARHMAFSAPYRRVMERAGEDAARYMMRLFVNPLRYSKKRQHCEACINRVRPALDALCDFFRTRAKIDPRRVVKRQLGSTIP